MVTDEEYRKLQKRVDDLEKRLTQLSLKYSSLYMRSDMKSSFSNSSQSNNSSCKRDTTKYVFMGESYCKRQMVLICIKQYIKDHPGCTGEKLSEIFPDYIQGSLGVVRKASEAEKYSNAKSRFFFSDQDVLVLQDGHYVVCAQWDKNNIKRFLKLFSDLGYQVNAKTRKY